jgi:cytochrome P450
MRAPALKPPLTDPDFYAGDPFPIYQRLRAEAPVYWHDDPGFWAVTRHDDVIAVSSDPGTFCSSQGTMLADLTRPIMARQSILYIDPPEHVKYRKLVQPAFNPARIRALEPRIRAHARALAAGMEGGAPLDFVEAFAAPLPLLVIAEMLGVPGDDRARFRDWSDAVIDAATAPAAQNMAATNELLAYLGGVIRERRARPEADLISTLVAAEIDGERLDDSDVLMFCLTLLVAGNETTRNLLSHGTLALATHPSERAALAAEPGGMPAAVEEMLRWGSPITSFMRTATRDAVLRGQRIRAGERVLVFYAAANRDEDVFGPDAEVFRCTRDASRHVAFGFGAHFCLGASLARLEAQIAFEELLARFRGIELAGPVERLRSPLVRGIVHLPVAFGH